MNISFSTNHLDKENIKGIVIKYPELFYNEHEFINSLFEFLKGDKEKFIIHYHPLNSLNFVNNPEVKLPVYQIHKYKFINKETHLLDYESIKPDLEILATWAGNLYWCEEPEVPFELKRWQDTLNQIFINGKHLDVNDLANSFDYIQRMILDHDKSLLNHLLKIKNSDNLFDFINTFLQRIKHQYNDSIIRHCTHVIPQRIKAVCPDKLEQYNNFIELFLSKERWEQLGINIEDRPLYQYLKPDIYKENIETKLSKPRITTNKEEDDAIQIFQNNGYKLFKYLEEKYTRDDSRKPSKYSNIFHFLDYHDNIIGTKELYKKFILEYRLTTISRIQDQTFKYEDKIKPLLMRFTKQYIENESN